jgi:hypothetical protein
MITTTFVKRLVKPLLERHADLALVGYWIFVKPVHHFARGILIGPTPYPKSFSLRWAVMHLFEPRRSFPLDWGAMDSTGRRRLRRILMICLNRKNRQS